MPNMAMPTTNTPTEHILMMGLLKSDNGIIGSIAFVSAYTNAPDIAAAIASSSCTRGADQPLSVTQVSASSNGTTHAIKVNTPAQSICRFTSFGRQNGK